MATCRIQGVVVNAARSEPLKRAQVILFQINKPMGMSYSTISGVDGRFGMADIEPGTYYLSASRRGFIRAQYGARRPGSPGTTLALERGQSIRDLVIRMVPQAVITGRVVDEDGDPVAHVQVQSTRYDSGFAKRQFRWGFSDNTNDLGEYRISGVAPGRYLVSATILTSPETPVMLSAAETMPRIYAQTYYPATIDPSSATTLEITAGAQLRSVDVMLVKTRVVSVKGRVYPPPGGEAQAVEIRMNRRKAGWTQEEMGITVGSQGDFVLHSVIPGSYTLLAVWHAKQMLNARQEIEVGEAGLDDVVLTGIPGMELTGRIFVEGQPEAPGEARISLVSGEERWGQSADVKDDGSFKISNVMPDKYKLQMYGLPETHYVKVVHFAGRDALDSGLDLTRNASGPIEIVVSSNGGQVTGSVTDVGDKPVTAALVALVPDGKRRHDARFQKQASTDQQGRYTIKGITPGEYKLFALDDVEYGAFEDSEFLKPIESKGVQVTIREGSRETFKLKVIATEKAPARDGRD
jgi:protocatechuate 3,4-dioxygenase beta subunit